MNTVADFETRSRIEIRTQGGYVYAADKSTEVLCLALKPGDDDIVIWSPFLKKSDQIDLDADIIGDRELIDIINATQVWSAHNAQFERLIWRHVMHGRLGFPAVPLSMWRCTAAQAAALALPRKLEQLAVALDLPQKKDKEGSLLIRQLCKPISTGKKKGTFCEDRSRILRLCQYCIQDVVVEDIAERAMPQLSDREQAIYQLDQEINDRGAYVDTEGAKKLYAQVLAEIERLGNLVSDITKGRVESTSQVKKLLEWLKENDVELDNLQKGTVTEALDGADNEDIASQVLKIRQSMSKASVAKIPALLRSASTDSRLRGTTLYHAATTGRWGGRLFQPQNLPRDTYKDEEDVDEAIAGGAEGCPIIAASRCIRGLVTATPGSKLMVSDESSIEARITAWLAGEETALDVFRSGKDAYKVAAMSIYKKAYDVISKDERQIGKVSELALGYQGWTGAFHSMAKNYGVKLVKDEELPRLRHQWNSNICVRVKVKIKGQEKYKDVPAQSHFRSFDGYVQYVADERAVKIIVPWRESHPMTRRLWSGLGDAALKTIRTGKAHHYRDIKFGIEGIFLFMRLPNGRKLAFPYPKIIKADTKYEKGKEVISFMGINTYTRKWERLTTYGGKLTENAVQALARDVLADGMLNLDVLGYPIVLHVHDEVVTDSPTGSVKVVNKVIATPPWWGLDIPLGSEGWEGRRYRKA